MEDKTVECQWCGAQTRATAIKVCSNCWEIRRRLDISLEGSLKIIKDWLTRKKLLDKLKNV